MKLIATQMDSPFCPPVFHFYFMAMCRMLYKAKTACPNQVYICFHHLAMTSCTPRKVQRKGCTWMPSETRKASLRKEERRECTQLLLRNKKTFYSPLGEPDLRHLPSFAYQISQGMVCTAKYDDTHLQRCMFLAHCTVLPNHSGVPLLTGCPPQGPGLPQHPGG